jgi:hypothetical protein
MPASRALTRIRCACDAPVSGIFFCPGIAEPPELTLQQPLDTLLLAALATARRRFRLPPLPADAEAAAADGPAPALAFAIAAARTASERQLPPPAQAEALFTQALARLIEEALAPGGGDPAFQAAMLQAQDRDVRDHVRLSRQRAADLRAVRSAADAVAHPGKLQRLPAGASHDALAQLHALAAAGEWARLAHAMAALPAPGGLQAAKAALQRLVRGDELLRLDAVQRYRALCERRGPLAGSDAAAARGRASARAGEMAEHAGVRALRGIADLMNRRAATAGDSGGSFRVVRSLHTPGGFPGTASKAKEEWDAAIVRSADAQQSVVELVLLAEIKASPAAVSADLPRLLRGLQRLAQADAGTAYAFASDDGTTHILGASLRRLRPHGHALPPHVIYCCPAPAEPRPQSQLSAASKAVLLGEPASLAFAQRVAGGEPAPPHASLAPVWQTLATAPHLRATLHQDETARLAREAMLHPDDLLAAAAEALQAA